MDERFVNYTHYTVKTILHDAGFSDLFINELVMAALRTNYGQTPDVHGYVGMNVLFLSACLFFWNDLKTGIQKP